MWKKIAGVLLTLGFAGLTWAQQIDLNKASEVELDALKGVGPVLTKAVRMSAKRPRSRTGKMRRAVSRV